MADLRILLDERRRPEQAADLRRGRLAYVDGAEAQSRDAEARPLTANELERVTSRYRHDVSGGGAMPGAMKRLFDLYMDGRFLAYEVGQKAGETTITVETNTEPSRTYSDTGQDAEAVAQRILDRLDKAGDN